jgi:hypothetical protein
MLETTSAAIEATTGLALIADPALVVRLLIGAGLSNGGMAVGRIGGFGLLSLGLACWPTAAVVTTRTTAALFTYNLLSSLYIAYLGVVGGFAGYLLWPACALHAFLTLFLARPTYIAVRAEWIGSSQTIARRKIS